MSSDEVLINAGVSAADVAAQLRRVATSHADTNVAQPDDHFAFSIGDAGGIFMGADDGGLLASRPALDATA